MPLEYSSNFLNPEILDSRTGLKKAHVLQHDMTKELERLDRGGEPFSLALIRVDDFEALKNEADQDAINALYDFLGKLFFESLRSFDDAYILNDSDFALTLKLAHVSGGIRAIERIRDGIEREGYAVQVGNESRVISVSCCVAEPMPDEKIDDLIKNLSEDLMGEDNQGNVFSYKELSPLQRFAQGQD